MSVIFGRWNFDGEPPASEYTNKVSSTVVRYAPDNCHSYSRDGVSMLYHSFHTTSESRLETQPAKTRSGAVIMWDGRLDNRRELIAQLPRTLSPGASDVAIVACAYEQWEAKSFAKLIGDWALSIWDPSGRCVTLARDPIGLRPLYYLREGTQFMWSTILEPLVRFAGKAFPLSEEYIAGWLSFFPATHLTPYVGIHAVPPSSFLRAEERSETIQRYWNFNAGNRISYRADAEYEEHFRAVFAEAVRRRLRSDGPILAELSGGMDSSAIVCMADRVVANGATDVPRIDTVSYYDDSEPNWNEPPYFSKIEEKRGRAGCHINAHEGAGLLRDYDGGRFPTSPGSGQRPSRMQSEFASHLKCDGKRVVLSGLGGDEVLGGVPTAVPELADLCARMDLAKFSKQIVHWALAKRTTVWHLFAETLRAFLPAAMASLPEHKRPPAWLCSHFVKRHRTALIGYPRRLKWFGPLPTFQENLSTLDGLQRQLACAVPPTDPPHEKRYPYLDRDLLEFIYAIPREQLLRPGQRRSLVRRALAGIVPDEVLSRNRKAFVTRSPRTAISSEWQPLVHLTEHMVCSSLEIIDSGLFREALEKVRLNQDAPIVPLLRAIAIEQWLTRLFCCSPPCILRSAAIDAQPGIGSIFSPPFGWSFLSAENNPHRERR